MGKPLKGDGTVECLHEGYWPQDGSLVRLWGKPKPWVTIVNRWLHRTNWRPAVEVGVALNYRTMQVWVDAGERQDFHFMTKKDLLARLLDEKRATLIGEPEMIQAFVERVRSLKPYSWAIFCTSDNNVTFVSLKTEAVVHS